MKVIYAIINGVPQKLDLIEDGSEVVTEISAPKDFREFLLESFCQLAKLPITATTRLISAEEYFSLTSKYNIK